MDKIIKLIEKEKERQVRALMMIPSENYTYTEVRQAVGSVLMHKYAEGYPGKRYYQGNQIIDEVEGLCRERALEVFGLDKEVWQVNVQPHSGCEANLAVYNALLAPRDKILAMNLPDGGHLSHGWHTDSKKITLVSKIYEVEFYKVDPKTRVFDYDQIEEQAREYKPKMIISGGTAYPREIDYERMSKIAHGVGAIYLADVSHEAGLIAAGVCQSPFEFADVVTMTTHKTLRGPRGAMIFSRNIYGDKIDLALMPGLQGGPHLHTIAGIAVALEKTKTEEFKSYARQTVVNAQKMAEVLGLGGLDVVAGGTDKHLVLVDLREVKASGYLVALALERAGIVVNRNTVPNESAGAFYPSGIRLGTPALTVRGMKEAEMERIGKWILRVVEAMKGTEIPEDKEERKNLLSEWREKIEKMEVLGEIRGEVEKLCEIFPVPGF